MRCSKLTALLSLTGSVNAFFRQQTSDLHQLSCETDNPAIVRVYNGTIIGTHSNIYNQDHFLGVPFAQPPINGLRFRNPQSLNATFSNNIYQATEYAPACIGYGSGESDLPLSEDCLYLNVIRPSGYENVSLPVGLWIHGGGFTTGGSRMPGYNLSYIVENSVRIGKPIIGVSIAYRLSGWGFLASQQVSGQGQTNIALRDQRLAMHWTKENIGAFGGDAEKITIWGESAGAASVGFQLTAYNGRDDNLFWAAIMQSCNPIFYFSFDVEAAYQPAYDNLVNLTNCSTAIDTLDCLRHADYQIVNDFFNSTAGSNWQPIVDGDFIARWGSQQLAEGAFVHVPIIDGANSDEGTSFSPVGANTTQDFASDVTELGKVPEEATGYAGASPSLAKSFLPELLAAYPDGPEYWIPGVEELGNTTMNDFRGAMYRRSAAYWGDVRIVANRRGTCEAWTARGIEAYSYRFNTRSTSTPVQAGVPHAEEIPYVFNNTRGLSRSTEPVQDQPQSYQELAILMSSTWASFIHDRDPNSWMRTNETSARWPVYELQDPKEIVWDANVTTLSYVEDDTYRAEGIRFILDHAFAYRR
ncbi:alpha/beta-hydrolase [Aureobasidium pullulans]|nr:alpha/beta-hydrolase [Aureobasidium pullulans]